MSVDLEHWNPIEIRSRGHNLTLAWAFVGLLSALGAFFTFTGSEADRALFQALIFSVFTVWMIIEKARDDHHAASTAGNVALGLRVIAIVVAGGLFAYHLGMARNNGFGVDGWSGVKSMWGLFFAVWELSVAAFIAWELWQIHGGKFTRYVAAVQQAAAQQQGTPPRNREFRG